MKKQLIKKTDRKTLVNKLNKELEEEFYEKSKEKIKKQMKRVAMTARLLEEQQTVLDSMLSGKTSPLTQEEYLFEE